MQKAKDFTIHMLPLIDNKHSGHVLILGQSEMKNSYLMRIDDFLPLVDDYALFPLLGCMASVRRPGTSLVLSKHVRLFV